MRQIRLTRGLSRYEIHAIRFRTDPFRSASFQSNRQIQRARGGCWGIDIPQAVGASPLAKFQVLGWVQHWKKKKVEICLQVK